MHNGLLQTFEPPPGGRATVVRAVKSGALTTIENRVAHAHLSNRRLPLVDRCATFDGHAHGSRLVELQPQSSVRRQALRCAASLERHVNALLPSQYRVHSMTSYYAPSADGSLRFLYCPDLQLTRVDVDELVHPNERRPSTAHARVRERAAPRASARRAPRARLCALAPAAHAARPPPPRPPCVGRARARGRTRNSRRSAGCRPRTTAAPSAPTCSGRPGAAR